MAFFRWCAQFVSIVNGRPITKLSDDPEDPFLLTPNHIRLLRTGPSLPPGLFVQQELYRRCRRQVQYLSDVFWTTWIKESYPRTTMTQMDEHREQHSNGRSCACKAWTRTSWSLASRSCNSCAHMRWWNCPYRPVKVQQRSLLSTYSEVVLARVC